MKEYLEMVMTKKLMILRYDTEYLETILILKAVKIFLLCDESRFSQVTETESKF
jgi:hypothetical protein